MFDLQCLLQLLQLPFHVHCSVIVVHCGQCHVRFLSLGYCALFANVRAIIVFVCRSCVRVEVRE